MPDALRYGAMRDSVERIQDSVPGTLEITGGGIVHGEEVTIGERTISTENLPRYA